MPVRLSRLLLCIVLALGTVSIAVSAAASPVHYYLALGDSLARGYLPSGGDSDRGYVDDLYARLQATDPTLRLVKLGCSGETTTSMVDGGRCHYAEGSQLAAATHFLRRHPDSVRYVTLDIGANDIDPCAQPGPITASCLRHGLRTVALNLATILVALRRADHGVPRSAGMTYYDPFLQFWTSGLQGRLLSGASTSLLTLINTMEAVGYLAAGFGVADVAGAYRTDRSSATAQVAGYGRLPRNVATICALTFMCSRQNVHPNPRGYQVIAAAFERVFG